MGDPVLLEVAQQGGAVLEQGGEGQVEGGTATQGHHDFPDAGIEGAGGELEDPAAGQDGEVLALELGEVERSAVLDHHALGFAGGARGVDHIGEVPRGEAGHDGVGRGALGQRAGVEQAAAVERGVAEGGAAGGIGEHDGGIGIGEDIGQALGRIGGVEREIGAAGLEDGEQADDEGRRTLDAEGDAGIGLHAERDQLVREPVGLGVELGIADRAILEGEGDGIGGVFGMQLELVVQAELGGIGLLGGVPGVQQQLALLGRQDLQLPDRHRRPPIECLDHADERLLEISAKALRVEGIDQLGDQDQGVPEILHRHRERVIGALLDAQKLQADGLIVFVDRNRAVHVVQQRAEQRRAGGHAAALLRERERGVFVIDQAGQQRVRVAHRLLHAGLAQVHAQGQRVDVQAHGLVGAFTGLHAAEHDGAEHDAILSAGASEHLRPGQVAQARQAHAQASCLRAQAVVQGRWQRVMRFVEPGAVEMHLGEAEGQRGFVHVGQHGAEEVFMLLLAHAETRLRDRVAERLGRQQPGGASGQNGADFPVQDLDGGVIADQVMQQLDQQPAALLVRGGGEAQQRRLAQVDAVLARIEVPGQLLGDGAVDGVERQLGEDQRRLAQHDLRGARQALPEEGRAQDVVPGDHLLHGIEIAIQVLARGEGDLADQQVGVAAGGEQVMEEDAVLQRGERVDILDGAHATRHLLDQMIDLGLGEADEGQQLGRDRLGLAGDQVVGYLDFAGLSALLFQALGERAQVGGLEQVANSQSQPSLAQLFGQPHGEQGMPAECEEAVMAADALDAEQLGPDLGKRTFDLALGGFIDLTRERGRVGRGQRAAIELAVGAERQGVEPHEGGGHHVVGQLRGKVVADRADQ